MKTKKILISAVLILIFSYPVKAMDFIVGAKGGYSVWRPYFKDIGAFFDNIETGTGVLYGPVLSAVLSDKLSFSLAGLTGKQKTEWVLDGDIVNGGIRYGTYYWNSDRYDLDSALSYRLFGSFKIFLGYKVQYMDSRFRSTENYDSKFVHDQYTITTLNQGPALGVGYAFVFGKGFFSTVNLSALYMWGYFKVDVDSSYEAITPTYQFTLVSSGVNYIDKDTRQMGINFEPSIGYKAENMGLIFTLGFRFQWLSTKFVDPEQGNAQLPTGSMNDYIGGIYVSVLYTF